jgi:hypothetical protein
MGEGKRSVEPWFEAYQRALRERHVPLIYLLLSYDEVQQLAAGKRPPSVRRQAARALDMVPTPKGNGQ